MAEVPKYAMAVGGKIHKRWRDHHGPLRVICEPAEGYVMARRTGGAPFVLSVRELLNETRHHTHGPFEAVRAIRALSDKGGEHG